MKPAMFLLNLIKANIPAVVGQEKLQGEQKFGNDTFYSSGLR